MILKKGRKALIGALLFVPRLLGAWLLVHVMAFLGVFLAVAYPFMWLFFPDSSVCFLCRSKKEGDYCAFCRSVIVKGQGTAPKSLLSAIKNGLLVLVFSAVSVGVVIGEGKILNKLGIPPTAKTVSFMIPTQGQHFLGEVFPMKIEIAGIATPINAVQADISFEPSKLQVVNVSTEGSFASIFVQKLIDNSSGYVRLTGGLPNPGFFSPQGVFGTVYFRSMSPGAVEVKYLPSSMVLANDGRGTNVLKDLASVSYLILAEKAPGAVQGQSKMSFETDVLGERTEGVQMKFFEETQVLGASTETEVKEEKVGLGERLLVYLEKFDKMIFRFWDNLLERLGW